MKGQTKGFFTGIIVMVILIGLVGTCFAASQRNATLNYSGIKITLNGNALTPTDASGATVEPFTIDGTTYLPVRAIANAMGLDVAWNDSTQTVALSNKGVTTPFALGPGKYVVGTDIQAGKYDCVAIEGYGTFRGTVADLGTAGLVQVMGIQTDSLKPNTTYSNLKLENGDIIYIEGSLHVKFTAK